MREKESAWEFAIKREWLSFTLMSSPRLIRAWKPARGASDINEQSEWVGEWVSVWVSEWASNGKESKRNIIAGFSLTPLLFSSSPITPPHFTDLTPKQICSEILDFVANRIQRKNSCWVWSGKSSCSERKTTTSGSRWEISGAVMCPPAHEVVSFNWRRCCVLLACVWWVFRTSDTASFFFQQLGLSSTDSQTSLTVNDAAPKRHERAGPLATDSKQSLQESTDSQSPLHQNTHSLKESPTFSLASSRLLPFLLAHSLALSLAHSPTQSLTRSVTRSLTLPLSFSPREYVQSITYTKNHSLTHSYTHSLSYTHLLTH